MNGNLKKNILQQHRFCADRKIKVQNYFTDSVRLSDAASCLCLWVILHNKTSAEGRIVILVECARVRSHSVARKMTCIHLGTQNSLKRTFIWMLVNVENQIHYRIADCFFKKLQVWWKLQVLTWMKEQKRTSSGSSHICRRHRTRLDFQKMKLC